jgi:hypothetical protein
MPHDPIGDNRNHLLVRIVDTLPAAETAERKSNEARTKKPAPKERRGGSALCSGRRQRQRAQCRTLRLLRPIKQYT